MIELIEPIGWALVILSVIALVASVRNFVKGETQQAGSIAGKALIPLGIGLVLLYLAPSF